MITFALALFIFPLAVFFTTAVRIRKLQEAMLHDKFLYALCEVRDSMALLVADKKLSEKSDSFELFYKITASMIHNHRNSGVCFKKLIVKADASVSKKKTKLLNIKNDIADGPEELKEVAALFVTTIMQIIRHAYPLQWRSAKKAQELRKVCKEVKPHELSSISGNFATA